MKLFNLPFIPLSDSVSNYLSWTTFMVVLKGSFGTYLAFVGSFNYMYIYLTNCYCRLAL